MNTQDIQLDLDKSPSVGKWVTIGQGDKAGTTIRATVYDNGAAAALAGMSARFEMRMPNATYFEDTNCTVSGNVITYVVDESHAALYAGGGSEAYFALHDGDTAIYSTERFHVRVARAASDGANPGRAWTNGIEEWLEDASDELDGYVASADARVGATINAANAAVEGMRSDVDGAIEDTEDVIGRAEDAIDAMGDISELAVPLMSTDVRGGAKLDEHGGLVLRDEKLGIGSLIQESDGTVRGSIAELTAKGHAEQDGTPTPESPVEIQVVTGHTVTGKTGQFVDLEVQGKNLALDGVKQGVYALANGVYNSSNTNYVCTDKLPCNVGDSYEIRLYGHSFGAVYISWFKSDNTFISTVGATTSNGKIYTGVAPENAASFGVSFNKASDASSISPSDVTGLYVGLGLLSTTPIPLPQRGWVAGLPDGTADSLRLDGAGHVEWELADAETTAAATDGVTGTMGVDVLSTTGQIADGATVLYKLATPVTEDCGYVEDWPTDLPDSATISIPELDAVNISYFVDSAVTELAKQWYERAQSEYETRLSTLESIVAELV